MSIVSLVNGDYTFKIGINGRQLALEDNAHHWKLIWCRLRIKSLVRRATGSVRDNVRSVNRFETFAQVFEYALEKRAQYLAFCSRRSCLTATVH